VTTPPREPAAGSAGDASDDRPSEEVALALLERARAARANAYAPYSGFPVGAAILTGSGDVVTGCNVENAAYPLSQCAERVALGAAIAAAGQPPRGAGTFTAIAVVGPNDADPCWPCGGCRQLLWEFAPELWVVSPSGADGMEMARLSELLPRPFGPRTLEGDR
jgi:cytidine deaminase